MACTPWNLRSRAAYYARGLVTIAGLVLLVAQGIVETLLERRP